MMTPVGEVEYRGVRLARMRCGCGLETYVLAAEAGRVRSCGSEGACSLPGLLLERLGIVDAGPAAS